MGSDSDIGRTHDPGVKLNISTFAAHGWKGLSHTRPASVRRTLLANLVSRCLLHDDVFQKGDEFADKYEMGTREYFFSRWLHKDYIYLYRATLSSDKLLSSMPE